MPSSREQYVAELGPQIRLEFWRQIAIVTPTRPRRLWLPNEEAVGAFYGDLVELIELGDCRRLLLDFLALPEITDDLLMLLGRLGNKLQARDGAMAVCVPVPERDRIAGLQPGRRPTVEFFAGQREAIESLLRSAGRP